MKYVLENQIYFNKYLTSLCNARLFGKASATCHYLHIVFAISQMLQIQQKKFR